LKEMGDNMAKGLADSTATEKSAITTYDEIMAAKKKELDSLTSSIETKTGRVGELAVSVVQMKNDLSETGASLIEDKKYLADMAGTCTAKAAEWEERKKTRSEELLALADTITLLNDDDALELFKKTLPSASASFVQMQTTRTVLRKRALSSILALRSPNLNFIALALQGKKVGFEKVLTMIDAMVVTIKKEQQGDAHKKEYCAGQFDVVEDKMKGLDRTLADAEVAIADTESGIETTTADIAALEAGLKALDKSVAEASEQRKSESAEFSQLMSSDTAAKELLAMAKNRLNKFYNKALYKAAPKRELSEEDRIVVNEGGTLAPTAAPGGIAGTGISAMVDISEHRQLDTDKPAPPPETFGAYEKKDGEASGAIAMIDLLVKDLTHEMTEAETDEKNSHAEYEQMTKDSAAKRAEDAKSLTEKIATKAELEGDFQRHGEAKVSANKELAATAEYQGSLHAECDWLMQHYDVRSEARTTEIDSLTNAKAILSGADFGL